MSPRERRFKELLLADAEMNATEAARLAGFSAKTANTKGPWLRKRPDIAAEIDAALAERSKRTQIDADWLLTHLAEEATADIADLYDDAGNIKPVHQWPIVWRTGLVAGFEVEELYEGRGENREHIGRLRKVKLADRTRIKELIGKHVGVQAFVERKEITGKNGGPVLIEGMRKLTDAELAVLAKLDASDADGAA